MSHNLIIEPNLKKHKKLNLLAQKVSEMNSLILAYSGGVDSTFLAAISNYVLGDNMIAVIADSPSLPKSELEYAIENVKKFKIPYTVIKTQELKREDYIKNNSNRCYFCKDELYIHLKTILLDKGFKFRSMNLPDIFIEQDNPKKMYDKAGLNSFQISKKILDIYFQKETIRVVKN